MGRPCRQGLVLGRALQLVYAQQPLKAVPVALHLIPGIMRTQQHLQQARKGHIASIHLELHLKGVLVVMHSIPGRMRTQHYLQDARKAYVATIHLEVHLKTAALHLIPDRVRTQQHLQETIIDYIAFISLQLLYFTLFENQQQTDVKSSLRTYAVQNPGT